MRIMFYAFVLLCMLLYSMFPLSCALVCVWFYGDKILIDLILVKVCLR